MSHQEYWSGSAAASALLGMAMVFTVWWWYFDGADAVAERTIRSTHDVARFHLWSYAHFPLYLGIAVTGVGTEHVITTAIDAPLHVAEGWILCAAVMVLMISLVAIDITRARADAGSRRFARAVVASLVAGVTLSVGAVSNQVMPVFVIGGLTFLCSGQLILALRR